MIAGDGYVKVLDFGLAKLRDDAGDRRDGTRRMSLHRRRRDARHVRLHVAGAGARRRPIDHRTDVFSFGCVLYECVTGAAAFAGPIRGRAHASRHQ